MEKPPELPGTSQSSKEEQQLFFNTATISRFMRACFGADAPKEAQRHINDYMAAGDFELAEIWKRVLAHLLGIETKEDPRRIVKVTKPLKVKRQ